MIASGYVSCLSAVPAKQKTNVIDTNELHVLFSENKIDWDQSIDLKID